MLWPKLLALLVVAVLAAGLFYLGNKIPPNDSGSDG